MKIAISETAYLYYLVKELENSNFFGHTIGLTFFPTLREESKLGYDAKINKKGRPLFIQTKVSEYMTRSDAREWSSFNKPYFRFNIYPDSISHQHNLLIDLASTFPHSVYYVGPLFFSYSTFANIVMNRILVHNSEFISLNRFRHITGDEEHTICYSRSKLSKMWSNEAVIEDSFDGFPEKSFFDKSPEISYQFFLDSMKKIGQYVAEKDRVGGDIFTYFENLGTVVMFCFEK